MQPENNKFEEFSRYAGEEKLSLYQPKRHVLRMTLLILLLLIAAAAAAGAILRPDLAAELRDRFFASTGIGRTREQSVVSSGGEAGGTAEGSGNGGSTAAAGQTEADTVMAPEPETTAETELPFAPHCTETTNPANQIAWTEIEVNGETLENTASYTAPSEISFGYGEDYRQAAGIFTFRGNNFRDDPTYGNTFIKENRVEDVWSVTTGSLQFQDALWTGSGWTGQPLMRMWTREEKQFMNMYDWAKAKDGMVEVVYACMDGYVYFLDLETGESTRDTLYLGFTFKGAGALDPRGYPLLYLGAGYNSNQGYAHTFIVSLIDLSVQYTFGDTDPFSLRGTVSLFDASPLVDAGTDTLIWPGENGILYLVHLNTQYDPASGQISVNPDRFVKWHYYGVRTNEETYWLGMETSPAVYKGYLFVADNGGDLMCLDLNTLQLVWTADTLDDSNSTPVLSIEDGHLYLYVSTSFHIGWRANTTATVPIWKIDAETGEKIWQTDYECCTIKGVSGGVQSTIALGKGELDGCIYATVSMTGNQSSGVLACIDCSTGEVKWEHSALYAWSSPVCIYDADGTGRVLYCSSGGTLYILDGKTGEELCAYQISDGNIEASPAVWNNYLVVGTRTCRIRGVRLV